MIEINLLPNARPAAPSASRYWADARAILANITNPWLLGAIAAWVLILGAALALFVTSRTRLAVLHGRLESVQAEKRRYDVVIAQKRQSERLRDSLVREIAVIRSMDGARYVWPHILDQLAKALPPYTWLTSVTFVPTGLIPTEASAATTAGQDTSLSSVRFTITGSTIDIQAYTTLLRQLAASPWFTGVVPATTMTVTEQDRPVTAFTVEARYRSADSAYLHMVPLRTSSTQSK